MPLVTTPDPTMPFVAIPEPTIPLTATPEPTIPFVATPEPTMPLAVIPEPTIPFRTLLTSLPAEVAAGLIAMPAATIGPPRSGCVPTTSTRAPTKGTEVGRPTTRLPVTANSPILSFWLVTVPLI